VTWNTTISSWTTLLSNMINRNAVLVKDKSLSAYDDSLVGYWDMETTMMSWTQVVFKDLSKYWNNGACYDSWTLLNCLSAWQWPQSVNWISGIWKAMNFNWINNIIRINDSPSLSMTWSMTMMFYFKPNIPLETQPSWTRIVTKWNDKNSIRTWYEFLTAGLASSWRVCLSINDELNINRDNYVNASYVPEINKWWFVWATFKKGENTSISALYFNGRKISESDLWNHTISHVQSQPFVIGWSFIYYWASVFLPGYYFNWIIDEVRIYNRTLSASEIQSMYMSLR
jgi:hypothetical protein